MSSLEVQLWTLIGHWQELEREKLSNTDGQIEKILTSRWIGSYSDDRPYRSWSIGLICLTEFSAEVIDNSGSSHREVLKERPRLTQGFLWL